jgi:hypothetical protein
MGHKPVPGIGKNRQLMRNGFHLAQRDRETGPLSSLSRYGRTGRKVVCARQFRDALAE